MVFCSHDVDATHDSSICDWIINPSFGLIVSASNHNVNFNLNEHLTIQFSPYWYWFPKCINSVTRNSKSLKIRMQSLDMHSIRCPPYNKCWWHCSPPQYTGGPKKHTIQQDVNALNSTATPIFAFVCHKSAHDQKAFAPTNRKRTAWQTQAGANASIINAKRPRVCFVWHCADI